MDMTPDSVNYRGEDVSYLRELWKQTGYTQRALARILGINPRGIQAIMSGDIKRYKVSYCEQFALEVLAKQRHTEEALAKDVKIVKARLDDGENSFKIMKSSGLDPDYFKEILENIENQ